MEKLNRKELSVLLEDAKCTIAVKGKTVATATATGGLSTLDDKDSVLSAFNKKDDVTVHEDITTSEPSAESSEAENEEGLTVMPEPRQSQK